MINLIPQEEKKKMVKVFYHKLAVLFLMMACVSTFLAFVAIMPSYFLSLEKNDIVDAKLERQKSEPVPLPDQQTLAVIKDLNGKFILVENSEKNKFAVSQKVIDALITEKMPDIKITDISYENNPVVGKKISIQGTASSREVLLLFRLALENESQFKQVDLPISNFIKGSDIQFYLSLIPS